LVKEEGEMSVGDAGELFQKEVRQGRKVLCWAAVAAIVVAILLMVSASGCAGGETTNTVGDSLHPTVQLEPVEIQPSPKFAVLGDGEGSSNGAVPTAAQTSESRSYLQGPNCVDADNDGSARCTDPATGQFLGGDCDDTNPARYPGASESCNNVDDDCDGDTDEGYLKDPDNDTWYSRECQGHPDNPHAGQSDCNDFDATVNPGAVEVCDGKDNDCNPSTVDGSADPGLNDNNVCTDDACTNGVLVHTNNAAPCTDSNACTSGDVCSGGACQPGAPVVCNDSNVCTDDTCVPATGCVFTPDNTNTCSDNNACTTADACVGGSCVGGPPPNCNDSNVCTDDTCAPATGCVNANNAAPCDDGSRCTDNDTCSGGACAGTSICGAGTTCTNGSCTVSSASCGPGTSFQNNQCVAQPGACATNPDGSSTCTLADGSVISVPAEVCDGLDNDRDGQIDEGLADCPADCYNGTQAGFNGRWILNGCANPVNGVWPCPVTSSSFLDSDGTSGCCQGQDTNADGMNDVFTAVACPLGVTARYVCPSHQNDPPAAANFPQVAAGTVGTNSTGVADEQCGSLLAGQSGYALRTRIGQ
jgi:hypothetical protein